MRRLCLAFALALLLPGAAAAQDGGWTAAYKRSNVVQQVGTGMFTGGLVTAGGGLALLAPKLFGASTPATDRIGATMLYVGVGSALVAPPVMLAGALAERRAVAHSPDFEEAGGTTVLGTARGGWIGVGLYAVALAIVPIAAFTKDRVVYWALVPAGLAVLAATTLISSNELAFDTLSGGSAVPQRLGLFDFGLRF